MKQSVTLSIESDIWKRFKIQCLLIEKSPSRLIEKFMINQLTKEKEKKASSGFKEAKMLEKKLKEHLAERLGSLEEENEN